MTPDGSYVTFSLSRRRPGFPDRCDSLDEMRALSGCLLGPRVTIVEFGIVNMDSVRALRVISSELQGEVVEASPLRGLKLGPLGRTFLGTLLMPFRHCGYTVRVFCFEFGTTGMREAAVRVVSADPASANPDDPVYDPDFPESPVARCRAILHRIESTCTVDPYLRFLPQIPYPLMGGGAH